MPVVQKALENGELIALGRLGRGPQGGDLEDVLYAVEAAGLLAGELIGHIQPGHTLPVWREIRLNLPHLPQQQGGKPGIPGGVQEGVGGDIVHPYHRVLPLLPGVELHKFQDGLAALVWVGAVLLLLPQAPALLLLRGPHLLFRFGQRERRLLLFSFGAVQCRLIRLPQPEEALRILLRVAGLGFFRVCPLDGGDVLCGIDP